MAIGTHGRMPPDTVIAPKETPTIASAAQTRAMSRSVPRSSVRHVERMSFIMNRRTSVRQIERTGFWSERMGNGSGDEGKTPPLGLTALIAASIRRERDRAGLSLTELARRAGISKSTLSQLESGARNPSVETLWALGAPLGLTLT